MKTIEDRLQKLESANRRYRMLFLVSLASFTFLFMGFRSQIIPELVQARKFEVVDRMGNVLVRMGYDDDKGYIKTYNSKGNKLVNLTFTSTNQGFLALEDGNGNENIRLSTSSDYGGGYLSINNAQHNRTITMYNDAGGGALTVSNNYGKSKALLKAHSENCGSLTLYNSYDNAIISLLQTTSGNGDFYLYNSTGGERIRMASSPNGGNIQLFNNNQNKGVELGITNNVNGVVNTYNSSGAYIQGIGGN